MKHLFGIASFFYIIELIYIYIYIYIYNLHILCPIRKKKLPKQNSSVFYKPHTRNILPIKKIKQYFIKVIQSTVFCSTLKNKRTQKKLIFYTRSKKWVKKLTCPYITSGISCGKFFMGTPFIPAGALGSRCH